MNQPNRIFISNNPAETSEAISGEFEVRVKPETMNSGPPEFWCLYNGPSARDQMLESTPYLLSSWLLREKDSQAKGLISPFAKLDLSKESKDIFCDPSGRAGYNYGFRLVGLEEIQESNKQSKRLELIEFKLLAGSYSFVRENDNHALLVYSAALTLFRRGELNIRNFEAWERHFS